MSAPETPTPERAPRRKAARRVALVPDTITSLGLLAGCFSFISAISGHFARAALMIGAAIVCDISDGLVARASRSASQFGLEYDSLSDVVAFGVAPATLAYAWALRPIGAWAVFVVGGFVICAALRLARFNIHATAGAGGHRFVGLPVPGAAAMVAGALFGYRCFGLASPRALCGAMTLLMALLAALMVSRVPYPALKGVRFEFRASPATVIGVGVAMAIILAMPQLTAFLAATGYIISGPLLFLMGERVEQS
jgi:CDP-diacylglycerol--serine O-phosphatidyltransferase